MPTIEIDGQKFEAENGQMLIQVADENGIKIPRFCYHKKLSVAANCRMCLVDVERAPKPSPACATPVMDGMVVRTKSPRAISAQKNVMEFLLINHPLDCPICDQGGECELQDVSVGYGKDVSEFTEGKRAVEDEALGSLIATEMTRCIHCTRCVRFGDEIAGVRELGATGRGEDMKIGTYVQEALKSEVSGNIIDLCPVGALTSRPYRFNARAWELQQKPSIAPHDCLGSHINVHVRRNKVMRVVPDDCESINETWLSDRDRFGYTGLQTDRLSRPLIKKGGAWLETDWQTALTIAVQRIKDSLSAHGRHELGGLASNYATTEEYYLFQKLLRALNVSHIDHRVGQQDFRDDNELGTFPGTTMAYEALSNQKSILLVGSDIHREQPLAGVRVRHAIKQGAKVMAIAPYHLKSNLEMSSSQLVHPQLFGEFLAAVLKAAAEIKGSTLNSGWSALLNTVTVTDDARATAQALIDETESVIIVGAAVEAHDDSATLRSIAKKLAEVTQSQYMMMTQGPNQAGAFFAGALPNRGPGGRKVSEAGNHAQQMIQEGKKAYLTLHLEPEADCADGGQALMSLQNAETVVAITAFDSPHLREYADVILPAATFAETSGTFVNVEGTWQSFRGAVKAHGESRPAWKILRVIANLIDLEGFEYCSNDEVLAELRTHCQSTEVEQTIWEPKQLQQKNDDIIRVGHWGIYSTDPITRRSSALQASEANDVLEIRVSPNVAKKYNLRQGKEASALQHQAEVPLTVVIDDALPENCVYLPHGFDETMGLGALFSPIDLK